MPSESSHQNGLLTTTEERASVVQVAAAIRAMLPPRAGGVVSLTDIYLRLSTDEKMIVKQTSKTLAKFLEDHVVDKEGTNERAALASVVRNDGAVLTSVVRNVRFSRDRLSLTVVDVGVSHLERRGADVVAPEVAGRYAVNVPPPPPPVAAGRAREPSSVDVFIPPPPPTPVVPSRGSASTPPQQSTDNGSWGIPAAPSIPQAPPPPSSDTTAMSTTRRTWKAAVNAALSLSQLAAIVPTFFVPVDEIVPHLPEGYHEEHLRDVFVHATGIEVVNLAERSFARIHAGHQRRAMLSLSAVELDANDDSTGGGGERTLSSPSPASNARRLFAQYRPDPSLCPHFVASFGGRSGTWLPLKDVVTRAPPAVIARLPFAKEHSLLYFAQMQHLFGFSPADGGGVHLLKHPATDLTWNTSPTPRVRNELYFAVERQPMIVEAAFNRLSLDARRDLLGSFPAAGLYDLPPPSPHAEEGGERGAQSPPGEAAEVVAVDEPPRSVDGDDASWLDAVALRPFIACHATLFCVQPGTSLLTLTARAKLEAMSQLPLEQQLAAAQSAGDIKRERAIRKRIVALSNPDSPLLQEDNLRKSVVEFLPSDRAMSLRAVKQMLPQEITSLFPPRNPFRFWEKGDGVTWKLEEVHHAGKMFIRRLDAPPPAGRLRHAEDYSDDELTFLLAECLSHRGIGVRSVPVLQTKFPYEAKKAIAKRFGGIVQLAQRHPSLFAVVMGHAQDLRNARISLLRMPGDQDFQDAAGAMMRSRIRAESSPPDEGQREGEEEMNDDLGRSGDGPPDDEP